MNKELKIDKSKLEDREFINIVDLMNTIGTSQNTIYRLCDKNELKKYKFRGLTRLHIAAWNQVLNK